jgi:hypothetical protein
MTEGRSARGAPPPLARAPRPDDAGRRRARQQRTALEAAGRTGRVAGVATRPSARYFDSTFFAIAT